jgi:hypothetical protein
LLRLEYYLLSEEYQRLENESFAPIFGAALALVWVGVDNLINSNE